MTHDHRLDQRLCEQILKRDDFTYFGLIGSRSKRRNFETRLQRRGIDVEKFGRMTCPIGIWRYQQQATGPDRDFGCCRNPAGIRSSA